MHEMNTSPAWTNHRSEMRYCDFALRHSLLFPTPPPSSLLVHHHLLPDGDRCARRFRSSGNITTPKIGGTATGHAPRSFRPPSATVAVTRPNSPALEQRCMPGRVPWSCDAMLEVRDLGWMVISGHRPSAVGRLMQRVCKGRGRGDED